LLDCPGTLYSKIGFYENHPPLAAMAKKREYQEGYIVRDVFYTGKVSVLMEREVNWWLPK